MLGLFYFLCLTVLPAHMYVHHMHAWDPCQRRASDPLGLRFQTVTTQVLRTTPRSSVRARSAPNRGVISLDSNSVPLKSISNHVLAPK